MREVLNALKPWVVFAGCVLVIAVLYWAQAVLVPIALSMLLTFLLTPLVAMLERRVGRLPAVLVIVTLAFTAFGLAGWGLARQVPSLIDELPTYRENIRQKISDIQGVSRGGSVEKLQQTVDDIKEQITKDEPARGTEARPVVVKPEPVAGLWTFPTTLGPLLGWLATAGLVIALVIFMLLEWEEMRNRVIRLFGHRRLTVTTKALDEAATRISRYLLRQSLINLMFGVGVGIGLFLMGVPYALLWAALAAALRFIPYVGPWVAAVAPILVSLAALEGWTRPLLVMGLFLVLELFANLVLEPLLYAGAAGVSQVALLAAVAFWTWLWGPLGLLMATPLTVCLVVLGKHVPGLEFLATLMADEPVLDPDVAYYQRLLAGDEAEASDLIERYVATEPPEQVYDAILLPALTYAKRDSGEGRLSPEEARGLMEATRDLIGDTASVMRGKAGAGPVADGDSPGVDPTRVAILGCAADAEADQLALEMLRALLEATPFALEISSARALSSEVVKKAKEQGYPVVCITDLPPSPPSKARYLAKKLRATMPDVKIIVGRWAPPRLRDDQPDVLLQAGADHVSATLLDTRDQLARLVPVLPRVAPAAAGVEAA